MISSNSRYADSTLALVSSGRGTNLTVVPGQQREWSFNFTYHQLTSADRIDLLAVQFYGDARLWWHIADANPEVLDWSVLTPGQIIRIPSV
ncbi:tail protein X [Streptomyces sp. NPDC002088]|uniref:LysM peptidoglycan-binding domain-containing protein n=1 Tax=Streptomyces sp. NPDC002088 TaxID=3154665 RepID=UPI0033298851